MGPGLICLLLERNHRQLHFDTWASPSSVAQFAAAFRSFRRSIDSFVPLPLLPGNCVTSAAQHRTTKRLISHAPADPLVLVKRAHKQSPEPLIQEQTFSTQSRTFHTLWLADWPSSKFAAVKRSGNQSAIQMPRSQQHRSMIVSSKQTDCKEQGKKTPSAGTVLQPSKR
jgi:hypothetical protein